MRVAVVCELQGRPEEPALSALARRQALAAHSAGAEVHLLVPYRPLEPSEHRHRGSSRIGAALGRLLEPTRRLHDGVQVRYVPFVAPPRRRPDGAWGAWAAGPLALALRQLHNREGFDLVHARDAVPTGDATRRALRLVRLERVPLVVSLRGTEVLSSQDRGQQQSRLAETLRGAALALASSADVATLASGRGAALTRVVHPAVDLPERLAPARLDPPTLVTVGALVQRKRHADVIRALAVLGSRHPDLRYTIIGDGPERAALLALALRLGVAARVELAGQLAQPEAVERSQRATLFVMPSTDEGFGLAYLEAMAAGVPALGCRGEPGPEEIAAAGAGFVLVPPGDIERLSQRIDELLSDRERLRAESRHARETVAASFSWERHGRETVRAYEDVLARTPRVAPASR